MKITVENQIGLAVEVFPKLKQELIDKHHELVLDSIKDTITKVDAVNRFMDLMSNSGNINYLMTKKAMAICDKIKVDEKLEPNFFHGLKVGKKVTLLMGDSYFRYCVLENCIMCYKLHRRKDVGVGYVNAGVFSIYTDEARNMYNYPDHQNNPFTDPIFVQFMQMLTFIEFTDTELKVLKPKGGKTGDKKSGKILNDTNGNVVVVDSTWNITSMRMGEFVVEGHIRMQRVGAGRTGIKPVYIKPHKRGGYVRKAKSETHK